MCQKDIIELLNEGAIFHFKGYVQNFKFRNYDQTSQSVGRIHLEMSINYSKNDLTRVTNNVKTLMINKLSWKYSLDFLEKLLFRVKIMIMFIRAKLMPIHIKDNVTWHNMYHEFNIDVNSHLKFHIFVLKKSMSPPFLPFYLFFHLFS